MAENSSMTQLTQPKNSKPTGSLRALGGLSQKDRRAKNSTRAASVLLLILAVGIMMLSLDPQLKQWTLSDFNEFAISNVTKKNIASHIPRYPCVEKENNQTEESAIFTIYIQTVWKSMHSETFYSFIHHLCSCDDTKDRLWTLPKGSVPRFYVGPHELTYLQSVYEEFNKTTCGPIFFGTPSNPNLTVVTTKYNGQFEGFTNEMFNDPRNIYICHNDAPTLEGDNVTNVFWLTPRHSRYVVPKYFPPTIVERAKNSLETHPNPKPVFLVTGSFSDSRKRNTNSLKHAMQTHRNKDFIIRFLGGDAFHGGEADVDPQRHESLVTFVNQSGFDPDKVQLLSHLNDTAFMNAVEHVDIILPLVDETNFYNTYEGGKKLTSAVTWGLGFGKKLVIYKPLAELFGIPDDRLNYWHYENSTVFANAFGECLNELDAKQ